MRHLLPWSTIWIIALSNGFSIGAVIPGPFTPPITSKHQGYITTNATVYTGNNYVWRFPIPMETKMIYIAVFDGYKEPYLKLAGRKMSKLHGKYGSITQYCFATKHNNSKQLRKLCQTKAAVSKCHYIEADTFNVTYKGPDPPNFKILYMYTDCSDQDTTTKTTTPRISLTTGDSTGTYSDRNSTTESSPHFMTVDTLAEQKNFMLTKHTAVLNTTNRGSTQTTAKYVNPDNNDNKKDIIIPVIIAAALFALVVLFLLFCGIRHIQHKEQMKMIRLASLQKKMEINARKNCSGAPANEEIYEEIAPVLPARNPNMQENAYEVPIGSKYGRNEAAIHSEAKPDIVTIRNELYGDESEGSAPKIAPNNENNDKEYSEMRSPESNTTVDNVLYATAVPNGDAYEDV